MMKGYEKGGMADKMGRALKRKLVPLAEEVNRVAVRGVRSADVAATRRTLLAVLENLAREGLQRVQGFLILPQYFQGLRLVLVGFREREPGSPIREWTTTRPLNCSSRDAGPASTISDRAGSPTEPDGRIT